MNFTTDIVIGIEIHVELATKTKLFCGCPRVGAPDEKPNTRTCELCLGHPGSKPVLNRKAVEYALRICLATGCEISPELIFSRKSYFYPDMSKNYQISQYEVPLGKNGKISIDSGKDVRINRIHMEEDPASLVHPSGMRESSHVLVDYNRSGNPLCEIVTEPDLTSPDEARDFMKKLSSIITYLDIFDVNSCIIKADANISIKESDYTRVEVKNITGFKEIERALNYEIERQKQEVANGGSIVLETRGWDADKGISFRMRTKESEDDYGYIIDPDLTVTNISKEWIDEVKSTLPELGHEKVTRYIKDHSLKEDDAKVIAAEKELATLFEKVAEEINPILAAKWLRRELVRVMNYNDIGWNDLQIDEIHLTDLLRLVEANKITDKTAQKLMEQLIEEPFDVNVKVEEEGLLAVTDSGEIEKMCKEAVDSNPQAAEESKGGSDKALNFLIGQVMRLSKGKADPKTIKEIIESIIK